MGDVVKCPCAGTNLDRLLQPTILALLADSDIHGYGLIRKIVDSSIFAKEKPDAAGIYRFLKTLEHRGLVESKWDISATGSPKKVYRITHDGVQCLQTWIETLEEYRTSIDHLLDDAKGMLGSYRARRSDSEIN
ncbi:MAG: PadR family transcriptional regulator [Desulfomonilaceae bacterium]